MFYYEKKRKEMVDDAFADKSFRISCHGVEFEFVSIFEMEEFAKFIEPTNPDIASKIMDTITEKKSILEHEEIERIEKKVNKIKKREFELMGKSTKELLEIIQDLDSLDIEISQHILDERGIYRFIHSKPCMYGTKEAFNKIFGKFEDSVFEDKNVFVKAGEGISYDDFEVVE